MVWDLRVLLGCKRAFLGVKYALSWIEMRFLGLKYAFQDGNALFRSEIRFALD